MTHSKAKLILSGIAASQGTAEGIVKIVRGIEDRDKFNEGDVLVTTVTDPTMVSMMAKASAIVCDIGSITTHASIVSRELGIPCVVSTGNGTKILKDGQKIKVDGSKGGIYLNE